MKNFIVFSWVFFFFMYGSSIVNGQEASGNVKKDSTDILIIKHPPIPIEEKAPDFFNNVVLTKEGVIDTTIQKNMETSVDASTIDLMEKYAGEPLDSLEKKSSASVSTDKIKAEIKLNVHEHTLWDSLLKKHVSGKGKVNYQGFIQDKKQLETYLIFLEQNQPDLEATLNNQLAYWMNAYNAFTVKLILDHFPVRSIKDIKDPWGQRFFQMGTKWYNLNDIEHKVLRKLGDPRIHFGINCASISCPKLLNKAFTANNVQTELESLAKDFINDPDQNQLTATQVKISKIFDWFAKDFKKEGDIISFLNEYADLKVDKDAKIRYLDYNWNLNN